MSPLRKLPRAPSHLESSTRRWWTSVVTEYELQEHHLKVLTACAEAWDRMTAARRAIDKHGLTYQDRFGAPKARPEVAIERDAKVSFLRSLRELALDVGTPEGPRPPTLPGTAGRR